MVGKREADVGVEIGVRRREEEDRDLEEQKVWE